MNNTKLKRAFSRSFFFYYITCTIIAYTIYNFYYLYIVYFYCAISRLRIHFRLLFPLPAQPIGIAVSLAILLPRLALPGIHHGYYCCQNHVLFAAIIFTAQEELAVFLICPRLSAHLKI